MSRAAFLDVGIGETRGVVLLDGRPERLIIEREGEGASQRPGARFVGRVRHVDRALGLAFIAMPDGADAVARADRFAEGQALEVEIAAEARAEKGASVRVLSPAEGDPRLLAPAISLADRLTTLAGRAPVTGDAARQAADEAEEEALTTVHPISGGGRIAIEPTRALVAIDVDLANRQGSDARRLARQTNLLAVAEAARLLRLKGLGGLVVIDLVGKGHDGPALSAAAKAAFGEDQPGVSVGPISRFGLFELSLPHRGRPIAEVLLDETGQPTAVTMALRLVRAFEREGRAEPGARLIGRCAPDVAGAITPYMQALTERLGARIEVQPDAGVARSRFEVAAR
jgi:Ribonuclease G/E